MGLASQSYTISLVVMKEQTQRVGWSFGITPSTGQLLLASTQTRGLSSLWTSMEQASQFYMHSVVVQTGQHLMEDYSGLATDCTGRHTQVARQTMEQYSLSTSSRLCQLSRTVPT